jgi:hypothetical protein
VKIMFASLGAYGHLHGATAGYQRNVWLQRRRTPPEGAGLLAAAMIDPVPPTLRHSGDGEDVIIPIRTVAYNESTAEVPAWLSETRTRPRVYLTLGTVSFGAVEVLSRAVSEIAALDVDVLLSALDVGLPNCSCRRGRTSSSLPTSSRPRACRGPCRMTRSSHAPSAKRCKRYPATRLSVRPPPGYAMRSPRCPPPLMWFPG